MGITLHIRFRYFYALGLIFLALGASSCANKSYLTGQQANGFGQCNGPIVDADVYLEVGPSADVYELDIVPVNVPNPGDVASITIANSNLGYQTLVNQVDLIVNQTIFAGYITTTDLQTYNILAITPYQPTTDFFSGSSSDDTLCYVPQPGDNGSE